MKNISFQEIFRPTEEQQKKSKEVYHKILEDLEEEKGCSTCANCKHILCKDILSIPDYVIVEECVCLVGLKCDTVLFTVKDCPKWEKEKEE